MSNSVTYYQPPLNNFDPLLKLSVVEEQLAKLFKPTPDRETIYAWIEDGTLVGEQLGRGRNWYVYASSLSQFILDLDARRQQKLAA